MPATRATLLCQYRYDALDRLTGQGLTDAPPLQRFYCKSRLATEIQGALRQTLFQHGDWLLAQQQQQGVEHATTLLAIDQHRSVLNTLKANHQAQPIAYAPYGHRQATNGWMSLMGFNGERPDPLTGHYLLGNGYRAFNPVLMRFNSPDSLSPFGKGGLNSYAYCAGDPVNFSDPSGHHPLIHIKTSIFGKIKFKINGNKLKPYEHITKKQALLAAKQYNEISTTPNLTLEKTLINDFNNRHLYNTIDFDTINLETITRKNLHSFGVSLKTIPNDRLPPYLHSPSPNKLYDQINLLEYVHGNSPQPEMHWAYRLATAAHTPTEYISNGKTITINQRTAEKYRRKIHTAHREQEEKINSLRFDILIRHFKPNL